MQCMIAVSMSDSEENTVTLLKDIMKVDNLGEDLESAIRGV